MSTLAVTNTLVSVFVPIGMAGAVIAIVCALVAAFALMRGSAGLAGGAVGVWIVGAMLSMTASFAALWTPLIVASAALGGALVIGAIGRHVITRKPAAAPVVVAAAAPAAKKKPVVLATENIVTV